MFNIAVEGGVLSKVWSVLGLDCHISDRELLFSCHCTRLHVNIDRGVTCHIILSKAGFTLLHLALLHLQHLRSFTKTPNPTT
jgi:hypothetical protein